MNGHLDLDDRDTDVAIWLGSANWPGLRAERLLDLEAFPVCSAAFLVGNAVPSAPTELVQLPLLGIRGRPDLWSDWLRNADLTPHYARAAGVRQSALALSRGGLWPCAPLDCQFRLAKGYYIVLPSHEPFAPAGIHLS